MSITLIEASIIVDTMINAKTKELNTDNQFNMLNDHSHIIGFLHAYLTLVLCESKTPQDLIEEFNVKFPVDVRINKY